MVRHDTERGVEMLRKHLILDDGIDVVIDDGVGDSCSVVVGFLRRSGKKCDKALFRICIADEETAGVVKDSCETANDWDIAEGFSAAELDELKEFLMNNIAMLCRTALDEETMAALDVVECPGTSIG